MKHLSPQFLLSLKVFGNEIQVFTLDDLPFLNGRMENMNIIKELYELTKGKQRTFKRNIIMLEVSHSVPTILGLPLKNWSKWFSSCYSGYKRKSCHEEYSVWS